MATKYLAFGDGNDAADGASYANRWSTMTNGAEAADIAPGDTVRIRATPKRTITVGATWTNGSRVVVLDRPLTVDVAVCEPSDGWTGVSATIDDVGNQKQGSAAKALHLDGYIGTDPYLAYIAVDPDVLSYYRYLSVWMSITGSAAINAASGVVRIELDDGAFTYYHQFDISPSEAAEGRMVRYLLDSGGWFSVNAVQLRVVVTGDYNADALTATIVIDNIFASSSNVDDVLLLSCDDTWTSTSEPEFSTGVTSDEFTEGTSSVYFMLSSLYSQVTDTALASYTLPSTVNVATSRWVLFDVRCNVTDLTWRMRFFEGVTELGGVDITINSADTWETKSIGFWADTGGSGVADPDTFQIDLLGSVGSLAGDVTLFLDNLRMSPGIGNGDVIHTHTLIAPTADGEWFPIKSITGGDTIVLDGYSSCSTTVGPVYTGSTTTTTTLHLMDPVVVYPTNSSWTIGQVNDSGSSDSPIVFDGGWNTTDMSTRDGETWLLSANGNGTMFVVNTKSHITISNIHSVGFYRHIDAYETNFSRLDDVCAYSPGDMAMALQSCIGLAGDSITIRGDSTASATGVYVVNNCRKLGPLNMSINELQTGVHVGTGYMCDFGDSTIRNCATAWYLAADAYENLFRSLTTSGNTVVLNHGSPGKNYVLDSDFTESSPVSTASPAGFDGRLVLANYDGVAGDHRQYTDGGVIQPESSIRHTASDVSQKMSVTSTTRTASYPLSLLLGPFTVESGDAVTVSVWLYRTDTAITGRLVMRGGQIAGAASDLVDAMSGSATTWEQVSVSFTAAETGAFVVEVQAFGGTTHSVYVDDLDVEVS